MEKQPEEAKRQTGAPTIHVSSPKDLREEENQEDINLIAKAIKAAIEHEDPKAPLVKAPADEYLTAFQKGLRVGKGANRVIEEIGAKK